MNSQLNPHTDYTVNYTFAYSPMSGPKSFNENLSSLEKLLQIVPEDVSVALEFPARSQLTLDEKASIDQLLTKYSRESLFSSQPIQPKKRGQ